MKLDKTYIPKDHEKAIYTKWEDGGYFVPKKRGGKSTFSIVMPPPNANANLHIGHALATTLEDVMTRYHRMKGDKTLFLPGADHAGFETQVVFERHLEAEGKSRFDFTREELFEQVWDFVASNRDNMENQTRDLGASVDWSRMHFTLDQNVIDVTNQTFKKLFDDKLLYRGERLVNYCTFHGTSFSELEVSYKETSSSLWYIKYPLVDSSDFLTVATTRPETMLGDTAVAVDPNDERYTHLVGKQVNLPLSNRTIPIIADEAVDKSFGTGAVKVTPAHDQTDFEIGERHKLPILKVIDEQGKMTDIVPQEFRGSKVEDARPGVIAALQKLNLVDKEEEIQNSVGYCYKCENPIQPLVREQWLINMKPLAKEAIKVIREGEVEVIPKNKTKQLVDWLENIRDWNISRQIAWGIPIPAFRNVERPDEWIFDTRTEQSIIEVGKKRYERDPDVFDTWFSSGQWPFITMGYPKAKDFNDFYPNSVMETGADILYFWVARMIMLGKYVTGKVPFKTIYLHGLVLDEHGAKMSKSKGNVIAPQELVEEFGADALRIGLLTGRTPGQNQGFSPDKVRGGRNFNNKLWNVSRFILEQLETSSKKGDRLKLRTSADEWMWHKLQTTISSVTDHLEKHQYSEAWELIYHLLWDDFADWYLEANKVQANHAMLLETLEKILQLAHPFAPFVTEAIWSELPARDDLLIVAPWPVARKSHPERADEFEMIQQIVSEVRMLRSGLQLRNMSLYFKESAIIEKNHETIMQLAGLSDIKKVSDGRGLRLTSTPTEAWLDVDRQAIQVYLLKLVKAQSDHKREITSLTAKLENTGYIKNAPKDVVEETKTMLKTAKEQLERIERNVSMVEATLDTPSEEDIASTITDSKVS